MRTIYAKGGGGAVFAFDVGDDGSFRAPYDYQLAKGDLTLCDQDGNTLGGVPSGSQTPPLHGPGSSKGAWADYYEQVAGSGPPEDWNRREIIEALTAEES